MSFRNLSPQNMFEQLAQRHRPVCSFAAHADGDVKRWKDDTLPRVRATLGEAPRRVPLEPHLLAEWEHDGLRKQKWLIDVQEHLSAILLLNLVSGIAVDPHDPNHAFISYSGYDAYAAATGTATGHVFEVRYNPHSGKASWKDLSASLGDLPVTGIAFDPHANEVFIATDFGVLATIGGGSPHWLPVGTGLPMVAVYGITLAHTSTGSVLYAATHGRSVWSLSLNY